MRTIRVSAILTTLLWVALLPLACSSDGGGDGGSSGSGGNSEPVACDTLLGKPSSGDACATVGEDCDISCSNCHYECGADLIWHEVCPICPDTVPTQGDACDPCVYTGQCVYTVSTSCGARSALANCDTMTSTWTVEVPPCP